MVQPLKKLIQIVSHQEGDFPLGRKPGGSFSPAGKISVGKKLDTRMETSSGREASHRDRQQNFQPGRKLPTRKEAST